MPAKYSHVKKRSASGLLKKGVGPNGAHQITKEVVQQNPSRHHHHHHNHHNHLNSPHIDRSITQALSTVALLERAIAKILLIRYEQDIARLFSTRVYSIALVHLPTFIMRCVSLGGPGWVAWNYDSEEVKDFFRAAIGMDMRQAGERVATKSVLWSYTALRHFALSNNVTICPKSGLHSLRLLPYYPALKSHLESLEALPPTTFTKPPHLGSLMEGQEALADACELKYGRLSDLTPAHPKWEGDWKLKIRYGYEKLAATLWRVAREFDVRGYGLVLREKLTRKWCDCGCSTDHLGEVCERTVREEEEESGVRVGKQREWDGRGSGVYGWETDEEEDVWEVEMDFGGVEREEVGMEEDFEEGDMDMTIGEMMEWRYFKAEREKEKGNSEFRKGDFRAAVKHYETAHKIEPEVPHYQLNLAAAHLKLSNWIEAEKACTKALGQHRSSKGFFRRAKARTMMSRTDEAIKDLRAVLRLQPTNHEALSELSSLLPPDDHSLSLLPPPPSSSSSSQAPSHPIADVDFDTLERLGVPRPRHVKPPPFARTKGDDRKLKISLMPPEASSADTSVGSSGHGQQHHHKCCNHSQHWKGSGKEKEKDVNLPPVQSGVAKEMERIRKEGGISYPSWDRYVVKRVD